MAFDGLEMQLRILESSDRVDDDGNAIMVCKNCYSFADDCNCPSKVLWPRNQVIIKLRSRLSGQDDGWN